MNILVIYYQSTLKLRGSQKDYLYSLKNHDQGHFVSYYNILLSNPFELFILKLIEWDLIIFEWQFTSLRFNRKRFSKKIIDNKHLKSIRAHSKICFMQDEFVHLDLIELFISIYNVNHIYGVADPSLFNRIYPNLDPSRIRYTRLLTGYISDHLYKYSTILNKNNNRKINHIFYRAYVKSQWGVFNLLKGKIGYEAKKYCDNLKLKSDILIGPSHVISGNKWYDKLSSANCTIGIEGGSDIYDYKGEYTNLCDSKINLINNKKLNEYQRQETSDPLNLRGLGPRHLEAVCFRTCQILVEGDYHGVLKPWLHYIPVDKSLSDLKDAILLSMDSDLRKKITDRAYSDIVESKRYTYDSMVKTILNEQFVEEDLNCQSISGIKYTLFSKILDIRNYCIIVIIYLRDSLMFCLRRK